MTATLTVENITLPVAPIGPPNPLPLVVPVDLGIYEPDGSLPPEVETNMRFGRVANVFPYLRQDNYTRARELAPVNVAVLENPHLRATFALGYGGRLLSLVQKQTDNELLFRNPVMQPANLALRNAWIAGGVEWNIGVRGHSPHTSSPTYAGLVRTEHLGDVLRLWEYERIRRVVYQIDFALAPHDPMLVWRTRIRNVTNRSTAMYWWTNIAVPEKGTRVFAPANTGIRTSYDGRLERVDLTTNGYTRPSESRFAADLFYESESDRPWIAAIDEQGTGVAHVSSRELFGRKLFVWGGTRAGDQWNRWLATERAGRYAEIQAGLTTTQYEHLPMAPRAEWTWTEALAPVRTVPAAGSSDWATAVSAVAQDVERQLPAASIESIARSFRIHEDDDPVLLASGSTWFHAERLAASGTDRPPRLAGTPFTDAPDAETQYWHDLATGLHITPDTRTAPASYVAGDHWLELLQQTAPDWSTRYYQAVITHARGDLASAEELYNQSLDFEQNAWSYRGLAHIAADDNRRTGDRRDLRDFARLAVCLQPRNFSLIQEMAELLQTHGLSSAAEETIALVPVLERNGRLRALEARIALHTGDLDRARKLLSEPPILISDLREGESSLSDLWGQAFPDTPLPAHYDFDMQPQVTANP